MSRGRTYACYGFTGCIGDKKGRALRQEGDTDVWRVEGRLEQMHIKEIKWRISGDVAVTHFRLFNYPTKHYQTLNNYDGKQEISPHHQTSRVTVNML